jgi:Uncharacterised nucleotidyltransferase
LRVDAWTAEVVNAFGAHGVQSILLKGPAIVAWLYPRDPHRRTYCDADLLVSPGDRARAVELLLAAGFRPSSQPRLPEDGHHAVSFRRGSDGASVDLHHSLHGMRNVRARDLWEAATRDAQDLRVARVPVRVLGPTMRLLHTALHLRAVDGPASQPWLDLTRALEVSSAEEWEAAIGLAQRLGITHELSARLRLRPDTGWLLERLGDQPPARRFHLIGAVDSGRAPGAVLSLEQLLSTPSLRGRTRYACAKLAVGRSELSGPAARVLAATQSLTLARATHAATIAARLPGALAAWRREQADG